ncbi:zinc-binding dehydrogenase [Micromonospora olivasterospora]|uniref:NADPH:quinone reductase-like Zn-dependent oxidoreductase n=1 Tax=Micromonospora olivasterospora TaxID=1880 RepID=A0A562IJB3_MICOL|nr:zinc-binding dehydrogenase [Micromonospora olivasterospora]TWH71091.1 NADPH:quinone reductase-like Zn-dependent oxidoreductase [Micromonospora olivasterospora]
MKFIQFNGSGGNEIVSLQEAPDPRPSRGQVLIAARYAGVNPADVLQRNGGYPVPADAPQDIPGLEVSGTVVEVGPGVRKWKIGDSVQGIVGGGGLANRVIADAEHLWAAPDGVDEQSRAALPEAVVTAFDALNRARAQLGDVVLIRGINGAVGLAAHQISTALGATAIGIGRSQAALDALAAQGITAVTQGDVAAAVEPLGGASVVIELVGGAYVAEDLKLVRVGGRIVVVSTAAGATPEVPLNLLMAKRADLSGTVLRGRPNAEKAVLVANLEQRLGRLLAAGGITIPIDRVFPAADATAAFDRLSTPGKVGKVLLDFGA